MRLLRTSRTPTWSFASWLGLKALRSPSRGATFILLTAGLLFSLCVLSSRWMLVKVVQDSDEDRLSVLTNIVRTGMERTFTGASARAAMIASFPGVAEALAGGKRDQLMGLISAEEARAQLGKMWLPRVDVGNLVDARGLDESPISSTIPESELRAVEKELARHIGPLAKVLVKRMAAEAANIEQLAKKLAGHITDPSDQRAFLHAVRQLGGKS